MLLIGGYISFPFFKIRHFETLTSLRMIYNYLLLPILFISALGTIFIYIKYLRQFNKKTSSKTKAAFQDIVTTVFLTCSVSAILIGMTVSTIVTTNAYCGESKAVTITGTVINYSTNTTKWGRLQHHIKFINSFDNTMTNLEVYRKYEIGEVFNKDMKIGKWGQLYSID